jgi:FdhD protein
MRPQKEFGLMSGRYSSHEPQACVGITSIDGVVAITAGGNDTRAERVAREEPLEIRLAGLSVAVTMRTPGDDFDLVTGFLITEGIVAAFEEIASIAYCEDEVSDGELNVMNVNLRRPESLDPSRFERNFYATSSCGICGKASIKSVRLEAADITTACSVSTDVIDRLAPALLEHQAVFQATGGLHGAGLFDLRGNLVIAREDVGRHNAVDKAIGSALRGDSMQLAESILLVSGRASFEIVQKALMARVPIVCAVSAPSSLAVELARSAGMTLIGFVRPGKCNVYSGARRVTTRAPNTFRGEPD